MTGLPSICDDFGTLELADRVKLYRPGWYVAWNEIDDDKMDAITPFYHVQRVAAFPPWTTPTATSSSSTASTPPPPASPTPANTHPSPNPSAPK